MVGWINEIAIDATPGQDENGHAALVDKWYLYNARGMTWEIGVRNGRMHTLY